MCSENAQSAEEEVGKGSGRNWSCDLSVVIDCFPFPLLVKVVQLGSLKQQIRAFCLKHLLVFSYGQLSHGLWRLLYVEWLDVLEFVH